mgnify:CR=1 FL=1
MENKTQTHFRTCHLGETMCGIAVEHDGTNILSIKGDPNHVMSKGNICAKASGLQDIHTDPDRLRGPVKRVGDEWVDISWTEAFEETATRLADIQHQYGNNAVGIYLGNPNVHNYSSSFSTRGLVKAWGAKGIYSASTLDQLPHMICQKWVYGHNALYPVPDIDRTMFMLCVGGNPLASNGSLWTVPNVKKRIQRLQARGGKFVVVDPRKTETAKIADGHHFVRPGTDTALFLGLLLALDEAGLVNPGRLMPMLNGWDKAWTLIHKFNLEELSDYCGIPAGEIRAIAAELGSGQPAIVYGRMGVSVARYGTLNHYLIQLLNIATGNVDREGGVMFPDPIIDPVERSGTGSYGRYQTRLSGRPEVLGELPAAELAPEITTEGEGQIGALITLASNPVISAPGGRQLDAALETLDLMVSIDMYITETTRHADYILPPCGPLEKDHYPMFFAPLAIRNFAVYSAPLFEKAEGSKADWEIMADLAAAIGAAKGDNAAPDKVEPHIILDEMMKSSPHSISLAEIEAQPNGYDMGPLKPRLPERLKTEDGLIHCAPEMPMKDLAAFKDDFTIPAKDSFSLIGRRHLRSNNSWLHNSHRLLKGPNRCTLMIHPDDAMGLGLAEGDMAEVSNHVGKVELPIEITEDIMPSVVSMPHGYGHGRKGVKLSVASEKPGVSMNDLTDPAIVDDLSGNAVLNAVPVQITKAA